MPDSIRVAGNGAIIDATLVLDTNAYASGDVLFVPQPITDAVRVAGGRAFLQSLEVFDEDDQGAAFDLLLMDAFGSIGTINVAAGPTDAVARSIVTTLPVAASDYVDLANSQHASIGSIGKMFKAAAGSTTMWIAGIARGTPTHTASGIRLKLGVMWD